MSRESLTSEEQIDDLTFLVHIHRAHRAFKTKDGVATTSADSLRSHLEEGLRTDLVGIGQKYVGAVEVELLTGPRKNLVTDLRSRIEELERLLKHMPCHLHHTADQIYLCAACKARESIKGA